MRLSSDFLSHFTSFKALNAILKNGFRYSLNVEYLPINNEMNANYLISFCDVIPSQSKGHFIYGKNIIILNKLWGIKNGVSPVMYIHDNSPGMSKDYLKYIQYMYLISTSSKNDKLFNYEYSDIFEIIGNLLIFKQTGAWDLMYPDKQDLPETLDKLKKLPIKDKVLEIKEKFDKMSNHFKKDTEVYEFFLTLIREFDDLFYLIASHISHVTRFQRAYSNSFRGYDNKILYDEREWRSVISPSTHDVDLDELVEKYRNSIPITDKYVFEKIEYLPEEFNLKFSWDDISMIVLEKDSDLVEMQESISFDIDHPLNGQYEMNKSKFILLSTYLTL